MTKQKRIDNPDVIPYALYELGGAGEFVEVEDAGRAAKSHSRASDHAIA